MTRPRGPAPEDTIAAIVTPAGDGGLGVIRLSGPGAVALADRIFRSQTPLSRAPSHSLHHGHLQDRDITVDEAVAGFFRAPRSYTGEDVVEFSCHGGTLLLKRVLDLCLNNGARLAGPGEFTRRAYLNGKMDLAQAEAVADLISARSETLRRAGMAQLGGGLSRRVEELRKKSLDLLAQLEANLDFVDDEVPGLPRARLAKQLKSLGRETDALLATAGRGRLLRTGLRVALAGKPNAGKSSLFNALLGEDRAIVAARPGTTRDTLEERLVIRDIPVVLTDTAGLRTAARAAEKEGVLRARDALARADVVLWTVDGARRPRAGPGDRTEDLNNRPALLVLTKADLVAKAGRADRLQEWRRRLDWTGAAVFTSARTGEGLPELRLALGAVGAGAGRHPSAPVPQTSRRSGQPRSENAAPGPVAELPAPGAPEALMRAAEPLRRERNEDDVLINARHEDRLREAREAFTHAGAPGAPEEAAALELRRALAALGAVTGRDGADLTDEVLDGIFSRFCIGK